MSLSSDVYYPVDPLIEPQAIHLVSPNGRSVLCEATGKRTHEINWVTCQTCRDRHELIMGICEERDEEEPNGEH